MLKYTMVLAAAGFGLSAQDASAQCAADLNGDSLVNAVDLFTFFGCLEKGCPTDFDGSGVVDGEDLGFLLGHWGACTEDITPIEGTTELVIVEKTDEDTLAKGYREYDVFVQMMHADDALLSVYNANISCTECPNGFLQDPVGSAIPLIQFLWDTFGMTFDSFVTIGIEFGDNNAVNIDPQFSESDFSTGASLGENAGWFNGAPSNDQGLAGSYPNDRVLIATFTLEPGAHVQGTLMTTIKDHNGAIVQGGGELEIDVAAIGADLNGDGVVGPGDLAIVLGSWGPCPGCDADLDDNGIVNAADLAIVLGNWD